MTATDEPLRAAVREALARFIDPDDDTMPALNTVDGGFTWTPVDPVIDRLAAITDQVTAMYLDAMAGLGKAMDKLDAIRELHRPVGVYAAAEAGVPADCGVCGPLRWPCPTVDIVYGETP